MFVERACGAYIVAYAAELYGSGLFYCSSNGTSDAVDRKADQSSRLQSCSGSRNHATMQYNTATERHRGSRSVEIVSSTTVDVYITHVRGVSAQFSVSSVTEYHEWLNTHVLFGWSN